MAEGAADGEPQRRLDVKEEQNGEMSDSDPSMDERKERGSEERESLVLWKNPLLTLHYFTLELLITLQEWILRLWQQRQTVFGLLILIILFFIAYCIEGSHQKYVRYMEKKTLWCAYWVGLGILSSVGLGTGLHTFLLYLLFVHKDKMAPCLRFMHASSESLQEASGNVAPSGEDGFTRDIHCLEMMSVFVNFPWHPSPNVLNWIQIRGTRKVV